MPIQRDHKLMLRPALFALPRRYESLDRLWRDWLEPAVARTALVELAGKPFQRSQDRILRFFDGTTAGGPLLRRAGYVLRECIRVRDEPARPSDREVSLSYRHQDFGRAAMKDVAGLRRNNAETELEADIGVQPAPEKDGEKGAPLRRRYAQSTRQRLPRSFDLGRLRQPLELFPGLARGLEEEGLSPDPEMALPPVSGLTLRERLFDGPMAICAGAATGLSLALWFDEAADPGFEQPLLAEVSYRLSPGDLKAGVAVIDAAERLLLNLRHRDFFGPVAESKTAFVYDHATQ